MKLQVIVRVSALAMALAMAGNALAQTAPMAPDITGKKFVAPEPQRDFTKRVAVSYTHLDVYKRQDHHRALDRASATHAWPDRGDDQYRWRVCQCGAGGFG